MPIESTSFTLAGAPKAVADVYHRSREKAIADGMPADKAHSHALRMVHHAGWYRGKKGWKQLTPDLRSKIAVRDPIKQPDGRYVIEDVDVFYPNAAKEEVYDEERIGRCIDNTNRLIAQGGQRPGLIEGHPPELPEDASTVVKAQIGGQFRPVGYGVNWRRNPNRKGWARCDLVDVDPSYIARQRERPLTGLSAGIARDAGNLNERFAHIASLGSSMQALGHIPRVELSDIFSANQICFSAEAPVKGRPSMPEQYERIKESELARGAGEKDAKRIAAATYNKHHPDDPVGPHTDNHSSESKGKRMPLTAEHSKLFSDMGDVYAARAAAMKSYAAGEPDCDSKMQESQKRLHDLYSANSAVFSSAMPDEPLISQASRLETQPGEGPAVITEEHPEDGADHAKHEGEHHFASDDPKLAAALAENDKLQKQLAGLVGKMYRKDFAAEVEKLRGEGHELPPQPEIDKMYSVCFSAENPKNGVDAFLAFLKVMPKRPSRTGDPILGAGGADPVDKPAADPAAPNRRVRQKLASIPSLQFSADDIKLGEIIGAVTGPSK